MTTQSFERTNNRLFVCLFVCLSVCLLVCFFVCVSVSTKRYVGPIRSAKNPLTTYIGVEWDDPSRGKHNGTVPAKTTKDGKSSSPPETYFVTQVHPQAGSFVLPKKVKDCGEES